MEYLKGTIVFTNNLTFPLASKLSTTYFSSVLNPKIPSPLHLFPKEFTVPNQLYAKPPFLCTPTLIPHYANPPFQPHPTCNLTPSYIYLYLTFIHLDLTPT